MARLNTAFDPQAHDTTQSDYSNLPDGIYQLEIEASSESDKNDSSNFRLNVTHVVVEPEEYKGRKLFDGFNLVHPKADVQEIANKQFAALCRAIGHVGAVDDSEDLHFRTFTVKIGMGKDSKEKNADGSPKYAARNTIKRYYFPDEGNVPEPAVEATSAPANDNRRPAPAAANNNRPAPATAAAGAGARPWGKKA